MFHSLQSLAEKEKGKWGRFYGLIAAAIIESRALFPTVDTSSLAQRMANKYEKEGEQWPLADRLLLLQGLGRLDSALGDPRFRNERWVPIRAKGGKRISFGWAPVTVQQYRAFVESSDFTSPDWWTGRTKYTTPPISPLNWQKQLRRPNAAVTSVTWFEATAYCSWLTSKRSDGNVVRLPTADEWVMAVIDPKTGKPAWRDTRVDPSDLTHRLHLGPVGAFLKGDARGVADLTGVIYQWSATEGRVSIGHARPKKGAPKARKIHQRDAVRILGSAIMDRTDNSRAFTIERYAPLVLPDTRADILGFRCVLEE
ncbi:formylglycine-generating enzyme family protein [Corallococcus sp. M7]